MSIAELKCGTSVQIESDEMNNANSSYEGRRRYGMINGIKVAPWFFIHISSELMLSKVYKTRAVIPEICIKSLSNNCDYRKRCRRIHPADKLLYRQKVRTRSDAGLTDVVSPGQPVIVETGNRTALLTSPMQTTQHLELPLADNHPPIVKLPAVNLQNVVSPQCSNRTPFRPCSDYSEDEGPPGTSEIGWRRKKYNARNSLDALQQSNYGGKMTADTEAEDWGNLNANVSLDSGDSSDTTSSSLKVDGINRRLRNNDDLLASTHEGSCSLPQHRNQVARRAPVRHPERCKLWLDTLHSGKKDHRLGMVDRSIDNEHTELPGPSSNTDTGKPRRPPGYPERCRTWLRGQCDRGSSCRYVHDDIEYSNEIDKERNLTPIWSAKIHNHINIKFSAGFVVEDVMTGFDTSWIYIHGIPGAIEEGEVLKLAKPFGDVQEIRMHGKSSSPKTAKILFARPGQALQASSSLQSVSAFGKELSVKLPVTSSKSGNATFKDGIVVVDWEPPSKVWYGGYKDLAHAHKAIHEAQFLGGDINVDAQVHKGLPAMGPVTVKFRGLPLDFSPQNMQRFANPTSVVWERPKYTDLPHAITVIRSILERHGKLDSFHVLPPPYRGHRVKVFVHFSSPTAADAACRHLHGLSPAFVGNTKIYAHHDRTVDYRISSEAFEQARSDIETLREHIWRRYRHNASLIVSGQGPVVIKLHARELEFLRQIKLEFEKTISGEVVKCDGKVAWDEFFVHPAGIQYLQTLQRANPGIVIRNEIRRIRLFGSSRVRCAVSRQIGEKVLELRSQKVSFIPLAGRFIWIFMSRQLLEFQNDLGPGNVTLDMYNRGLKIRVQDPVKAMIYSAPSVSMNRSN
ncbi:hypothetical protein AX17_004732 [Amanita inopinata Kibby_2008]|nr:hypothetical protein AX17_004732 [Amanita inopinata Kibby_2008]